jgi:hypothetical protein
MDDIDEPRVFLVRIWQRAWPFRATVRPLDDSAPRLFTAPLQLATYFAAAAARQSKPLTGDHSEHDPDR